MASIKLSNGSTTRSIELIHNASASPYATIAGNRVELTTDVSKTNGYPRLCFNNGGSNYYIREVFEPTLDTSNKFTVSTGTIVTSGYTLTQDCYVDLPSYVDGCVYISAFGSIVLVVWEVLVNNNAVSGSAYLNKGDIISAREVELFLNECGTTLDLSPPIITLTPYF